MKIGAAGSRPRRPRRCLETGRRGASARGARGRGGGQQRWRPEAKGRAGVGEHVAVVVEMAGGDAGASRVQGYRGYRRVLAPRSPSIFQYPRRCGVVLGALPHELRGRLADVNALRHWVQAEVVGGVVNGEHVITVDPDCGHAVGGAADGNTIALVLLLDGRRDRVAIISAESNAESFQAYEYAKVSTVPPQLNNP